MERKIVYIAGGVKGLPVAGVMKKFEAKHMELEALGYKVYNPIAEVYMENANRATFAAVNGPSLPKLNDEDTRNQTIGFCLYLMCHCEEVYLLPGWQESQGATLERDVALRLGIKVIYP